MINFLKKRKARTAQARELYKSVVTQARTATFYKSLNVPDTFDGRFEMISLHCFFVMGRLKEQGEKALSQKTFDVFFKDMDVSLRELGVGDVGIPKHMKRMMKGFNGRATNYLNGLNNNDMTLLADSLTRNVYGTVKPSSDDLNGMIEYMYRVQHALKKIDLTNNTPDFPAVIEEGDKKRA